MTEMVHISNGKYGHPDLKRAWDIFAGECILAGKPVPRIMQAKGSAKASADTHEDGMAVDWDSTDPWYCVLWRKITSGPAWPRLWADNFHSHAILPNCISAAYQVRAYRLRRDGLGWQGMQGKDTLPYYPPMSLDKALARWDGKIPVDGIMGPVTIRALQRYLNARGMRPELAVDGIYGKLTDATFERYLRKAGRGVSEWKGQPAPAIVRFQTWQGFAVGGGGIGRWTASSVRKLQVWLNK